jgi:hypothetical protein
MKNGRFYCDSRKRIARLCFVRRKKNGRQIGRKSVKERNGGRPKAGRKRAGCVWPRMKCGLGTGDCCEYWNCCGKASTNAPNAHDSANGRSIPARGR